AAKLSQDVVAIAGEAVRSLQPCRLSWGSGAAAFAVNRRNNPEAEVPARRAAGTLVGPADHDVPVLVVRDQAGAYRAVVFGYACHATVLSSYQWSGDYPGFAQLALEADYPGCVAMFWAGCGADQNPLPRRQVELAQRYGYELAGAVKQVLDRPLRDLESKLTAGYVEINLPFADLPTREQIEADLESKDRFVAARARRLLVQLDVEQSLSPTYPYPITRWTLGNELEWFFLGGEVVVDFALRLKSERRGTNTWVAGYTNDVMAYIPSRRVLQEGGYEGGGAMVYYGLPAAWAPTVEADIIQAASRLGDDVDRTVSN
ncbi:MAG: hypothetical protein KDB23_28495, partial [Planctomycetales bacterium]|nr:hypothetical protein [Planctomycetales bacterium]